jgi:hypothetical protein
MKFLAKLKSVYFAAFFFSAIMAKAQFTIQNGAVIKATSNAVITLQDIDLVNNGIINQQSGEGRFVFTGTTDNSIAGSVTPLFDIFEIAKTGSAKMLLSQNITIGTSIIFTSGLIDLNSHAILLQPTATLNGENANSRLTGTNGGYVEVTSTLNNPSAVNAGNLGAVITSSQNLGSTVIRRGHLSQANGSGAGNSIYRYFDILPANNTLLNATLRINYFDEELNGLDENTLVLWKSMDNIHWTNKQFSTRDASLNYVEQAGLADFSRWTLSSLNNALPVLFTSFLVRCANGSALVTWKTAQEQNSSRFDVQKSTDGRYWQVIAQITAAGNSNVEKSYSYFDVNTVSGKAIYRIAEHDLDNAVNYSTIAASDCGAGNDELTVHPNPVRGMLWVSVKGADNSIDQIQVFDNKGSLIQLPLVNSVSNHESGINMQTLPSGIYLLRIRLKKGNEMKTVKVIKE